MRGQEGKLVSDHLDSPISVERTSHDVQKELLRGPEIIRKLQIQKRVADREIPEIENYNVKRKKKKLRQTPKLVAIDTGDTTDSSPKTSTSESVDPDVIKLQSYVTAAESYTNLRDDVDIEGTSLRLKLRQKLKDWATSRAKHHVFLGHILDRAIKLWVDTGAPISLVSKRFVDSLPVQLHQIVPRTLYKGLGEAGDMTFIGTVILTVTIDQLSVEIIAAVMEQDLPNECDILLGNYDLEANELDFISPWDSNSILFERGPYCNFPSFITQSGGKFAMSVTNVTSTTEVAGLLTADSPLQINTVTLEKEEVLLEAGLYLIKARYNGPRSTEPRVIVPPSNPRLTSTVIIPQWPTILKPGHDYVPIYIHKQDSEPAVLSKGLVVGLLDISADGINEEKVQTVAAFDTTSFFSPIKNSTKDKVNRLLSGSFGDKLDPAVRVAAIGLLRGSTTNVTQESNEEKILHDNKIRERLTTVAIQEIKKIKAMTSEELATFEATTANKAKKIKHEGLKPEESTKEQTSFSIPGAVPFQPLNPDENAGDVRHDPSEFQDKTAEATLPVPVEGDTELGLTVTEFLVYLQIHKWENGYGELLINESDDHFFVKAVTRFLIYKEAGRFRLDYNQVLPPIKGFQYHVQPKVGAENEPFDAGLRRYSEAETLEIIRQVMQLMKSGVLETIRSPWSANLVLVKKAGGSLRMCIDFRQLNKRTLHLASQMPQISEVMLDSFSNGDKLFSQLDMSQAYHQLEVTEESKPYLAFKVPQLPTKLSTTQYGTAKINPPFQVAFKRLPFGLTDAVTAFSMLVREIFLPYSLSPYLDDLGIGSKTPEQHLEKLDLIFTLAARYGLTFGSKCTLFRSNIKFLGHVVDSNGVRLDDDRIKDLLNLPLPKTKNDVEKYMGVVNYCSPFLGTEFSSIVAPLTDLVRSKQQKIEWGELQQKAIEKLKRLLTTAPTLKLFENGRETMVITDGSCRGVGAALLQKHGQTWYPVAYLSKKFNDTQSRWNTSQHELFALVLALIKWRVYLIDKPFLVMTDHAALTYLKDGKIFEGRRLARWQMLLSEYDFSTLHKAGVDNGLSDCLSRLLHRADESDPDITCACLDSDSTGGLPRRVSQEASIIALIDQWQPAAKPQSNTTTQSDIPTRAVCTVTHLRAVIAAIKTNVDSPVETVASLFKAGDRVQTKPSFVWDTAEPGIVKYMCHKGKQITADPYYNILFDDGEEHNVRESCLESSDLPLPSPRSDEMDSSPPRTPQNRNVGVTGDGDEPQPIPINIHPDEPATPLASLKVGDLVHVFLGQDISLQQHYGKDVLIYLATVVTELLDGRIKVQLLLPGAPTVELTNPNSIRLIISHLEIENIRDHIPNEELPITEGDVVLVRSEERSAEIVARLKSEGVDVSDLLINGRLLGTVTGRDSNHVFSVHFGSFFSGVSSLTTKQLCRIKQGAKSLVKDRIRGLPNAHIFTNEELDIMDDHDWNTKTNTIIQGWTQVLKREQSLDESIHALMELHRSDKILPVLKSYPPNQLHELKSKTRIHDGILYYHNGTKWVIYVPQNLRLRVMQLAHDNLEHFDWSRTNSFISQYFYWRGIPEQCRRYVGSCSTCQKRRNYQYYVDTYGPQIAERVAYSTIGKHWAVDLKPVVQDKWGYCQLLVMVDLQSRYVITVPLKDKNQSTVVTAIHTNLLLHYSNVELLSDEGSEFVNKFAHAIFSLYNVTTKTVPTATPHQNGMVERFNYTFYEHFLKAISSDKIDPLEWSQWVLQFTSIYNASYHPAIGNTPYYCLHHRDYDTHLSEWSIPMSEARGGERDVPERVSERLSENQEELRKILYERYYRHKHLMEVRALLSRQPPVLNNGDLVLVYLGDSISKSGSKGVVHAGPFQFVRRRSQTTVVIKGADQQEVDVYIYKLVPYFPSNQDLVGQGKLAPSAVGAALARILSYTYNEVQQASERAT